MNKDVLVLLALLTLVSGVVYGCNGEGRFPKDHSAPTAPWKFTPSTAPDPPRGKGL